MKRCQYRNLGGVIVLIAFSIVLSSLYSRSEGASLRPDERRMEGVRELIDLVYADSFQAAYDRRGIINDTLPGRPIYNLITASILHAEMTDLEDYSDADRFFSLLDSSKKFFEKWIDRNPGDPWGYYFLGTVHAYKSMLHAQRKSWLKSLFEGLKAKGRFSDALDRDPTLYDAYAGLGNYHYWSSAILKKYIPFLSDNRTQGLKEMRLAVDSSYFSYKPAVTGLAWALIDRGNFQEALTLGKKLYKETSGGRNSLWILGGVCWKWGRLQDAEKYYGELINSLNRIEGQNGYNLIFCRYRRGVCLYLMRRYIEAKKELKAIYDYDPPKDVRKRHKKTYEKTDEYLKKIEDNIKRKRKTSSVGFDG